MFNIPYKKDPLLNKIFVNKQFHINLSFLKKFNFINLSFLNKDNEEVLTPREKLIINYHKLNRQINELYNQLDLVSSDYTDIISDEINMYTKMRSLIFKEIKELV